MELTTLGRLPIGAAFIRHDRWSQSNTVYIKLSDHGLERNDTTLCGCGSVDNGFSGYFILDMPVQKVTLGPHLLALAFALASSSEWSRRSR